MVDELPPRLPFERSAETRLLIAHLQAATVGQNYTYPALAEIVGKPVDGSYPPLVTTRRYLQREFDMVFATRPGVGIWRLSDAEIVDETPTRLMMLRRASKRAFDRLSKANFAGLPVAYQLRFSAAASITALVAHITKPAQARALERSMPEGARQLPIAETLAMFGDRRHDT